MLASQAPHGRLLQPKRRINTPQGLTLQLRKCLMDMLQRKAPLQYSWQIQLLETMAYDSECQESEVPSGHSNPTRRLLTMELVQFAPIQLSLCLPLVAECSRELRPSSNFRFSTSCCHYTSEENLAIQFYRYSREEQDVKSLFESKKILIRQNFMRL